jgi:hypothetical protein
MDLDTIAAGADPAVTGPPDQETVMVMAYGAIYAWLAEDHWTGMRLQDELARIGATMTQVAECFSLAAAALVSEACDLHNDKARLVAWAKYSQKAGMLARNRAA